MTLEAVVALTFTAWLIGLQGIAVASDTVWIRPRWLRFTTLALGAITAVVIAPRLYELLT